MTSDDIDARFAEVISGEELADLRGDCGKLPGNPFGPWARVILAYAGVLVLVLIYVLARGR